MQGHGDVSWMPPVCSNLSEVKQQQSVLLNELVECVANDSHNT